MKQFVIEIEYDRHLVQASDEVVDNLESLYRDFNDWLGNKDNDHGYWVAMDGNPADPTHPNYGMPRDPNGRDGLCFGADAFLKWLNENRNAQAEIVATESAGIHHAKEFFEWAKSKGYVEGELSPNTLWYDDSLYLVFVEETDCTPDILRLVEKHGVKRVYF